MARGRARRERRVLLGLSFLGMLYFVLRTFLVFSHNNKSSTGGSKEEVVPFPLPSPAFTLPPATNRSILLVHVGKSGGLTLREQLKEWKRSLPPNSNITIFRKPIHVFAAPHIDEATTFLVALRNPIDRIVSTYRYSHVQNCSPKMQRLGKRGHRVPFGCSLLASSRRGKVQAKEWMERVFGVCFPSAAMESFAQATMSPWPPMILHKENFTDYSSMQETNCRSLARQMVDGSLGVVQAAAPHMSYNYRHYAEASIRKHPKKEVWVVRLEHAQSDWNNLLFAIMGQTHNVPPPKAVSHGSEEYVPSPLSVEAYQKLCCVLHEELQVYQEFLERAINLLDSDRETSLEEVRIKCGIATSWDEWRATCQAHLGQDWRILRPV